jgi:hypothetical protein
MDHPHVKYSFFDKHGFSLEKENKPLVKFYMNKAMLLIYRIIYRMESKEQIVVDEWPTFEPLESLPVELSVSFREACSTGILQIWYLLIDIHFILLQLKFEDGFLILILKNMTIGHKNS